MKTEVAIHWFRQDLRLADNPALSTAAEHTHILPIYILDEINAKELAMGGASRWWLRQSLASLDASIGNCLSVYCGNPLEVFKQLIARFTVTSVTWNRCYEPWRIQRDIQIKEALTALGIKVHTENGSLLWEPWCIKKQDGTPYKVFTPFYHRGCLGAQAPRQPIPPPERACYIKDENHNGLEALNLLPKIQWHTKLHKHWDVGEKAAEQQLHTFIKTGLPHYKDGRNFPAQPYISRLSPSLHFGEVSPHQVWNTVKSMGDDTHIDHFCKELAWREFSYSQLYHNPYLPTKNLNAKFDAFAWQDNTTHLSAWQQGKTGIPLVDAGMRELWQTGFMHNRVRMIVGSFLVKNLRLHWHHGERWFWDTLLDADLANNSASWQWVAGCGADAAPYFRIFNPVTQAQKFDADGTYIRKYIPEIASLPNKYLFSPWTAPKAVLAQAGIALDSHYPRPIVDLKQSRESALAAFKAVKSSAI